MSALIETKRLTKSFELPGTLIDRLAKRPRRSVKAVTEVDLSIPAGETLGLIGESGSGKSTLGRLLVRLLTPTEGAVHFKGEPIGSKSDAAMKPLRRQVQLIFQDPYASLNPRRNVRDILTLPLALHGIEPQRFEPTVLEMIDRVGLARAHLDRFPHQFSGGQRQRIGIARALILRPQFVVCDEPVSALDVSVQAQILALLRNLRDEMGLTMLFISHDLAVVAYLAQRVAVMYLGRIVEEGDRETVTQRPAHPYTQSLLAAVPRLGQLADGGVRPLIGELPSPIAPPPGCAFHPRCPMAGPRCQVQTPQLKTAAEGMRVACHLYDGGVA